MAILKGMCNSGQTMYSRILNKSLKSLLEVMISDQQTSLAHIHIPELPVFNQSETNGMRRVPIKYNTKSMYLFDTYTYIYLINHFRKLDNTMNFI